ncbi:AAA domain-containing protein [Clostridium sp. D43t1_170807_H7]|uniref:DEAD/DEAH box helicase n=1 Tax=Clostridium sp. D43t1_170807_H7 TaxID=2787140 RepID=UPI001899699B|nr:AAA domain-containing protein [Clostridium sp. D43t1_170807_H7]
MVNNITKYFRSALIAKNQAVIDFKNSDNKYEIITREEFYNGVINLNVIKKLVDNNKKNNKNDNIEVIIVPKTIKTHFENSRKINNNIDELTGILYVPAIINCEGKLKINDKNDKWPWIPREFLSPMLEPQLSLGEIDDVDKFLSTTTDKREKLQSWSDYINYIKNFYKEVIKYNFDENCIKKDDLKIMFEESIYIILDNTANATFNIEQLYNDILINKKSKPLYEKFISPCIERPKELIPNDSYLKMLEHKGQMGGEYPLAESQREAINHFSELKEGEILAVSGPPGTGKTTLLQSIVADMYVKNALEKKKAPVIVASSTNNQAVTNIIDSFGSITQIGIKNLEQRWIEDVNSFAVYFPSGSKKDYSEKKGYQCTSNKGDGFCLNIDSDENLEKSKEKMIENVSKYFNKEINDIDECKKLIYSELVEIDKEKNKIISDLYEIRSIIKENTVEEYIKVLEQDILNCSSKEKELEYKKIENNKQICKHRNRVSEWNKIYMKIPWYIRLLKVFTVFREKIINRLKIYINSDEYELLGDFLSLDEIIEKYGKVIEKINSNNLKIDQEIKHNGKIAESKKNEKNYILKLRNRVKEQFISLKKYNCDIYYTKDTQNIDEFIKRINKDLEECSLEKINEYIDTRVRYIEFWLSVHYYECRWLLKEDYITANKRGKNLVNVIESLYSRLAMISPCMVMTFFMLPKQFKVYYSNEKISSYLYNFIDLLIVDEAGQVSPEIAAASFALAKKAIVVGDEKQIPPVWGISNALDKSLAIRNNILNEEISFENLLEFGQNCSQSSVMKIAVNSCHYDKEEKGLFLSEHRRCYNEIVEYCNELVYNGRLKACRGLGEKDKNYPLYQYPHMGYKNIGVKNSEKKGCSRINSKEAQEIAVWLSINYRKIVDLYKERNANIKDNEILAIITPFKAQVKILKEKLRDCLKDDAKNIDVGTVHTFQGAERKVIILSTVYGENDGCFFINKNESLMNVAVSRAKDAFWIFGARKCLDEKGNSSSALLKKYVYEEIE